MKKTLLTLLVVLSLVFCAAAQAAELPNPGSYYPDYTTLLGSKDWQDEYICWAWEHTLDPYAIETIVDRFKDECEQAGFTFAKENTQEDGMFVYTFYNDNDEVFALITMDENIIILAPKYMELAPLEGGRSDILDLPIFNTPEPTEPQITQDYLRGYVDGELVTLECFSEKHGMKNGVFNKKKREYSFVFTDNTGFSPVWRISIKMPSTIRAGKTYRVDKKQATEDMWMVYYKSSNNSVPIYDFDNGSLKNGDYVEVTIDYIASDNSEIRGHVNLQCGGGKYTFKDGEFSILVTEDAEYER